MRTKRLAVAVVSSVVVLAWAVVPSGAAVMTWDFEGGSFAPNWTLLSSGPDRDPDFAVLSTISPPGVPQGTYALASSDPYASRDLPHDPLLVRSDRFQLDSSGPLTFVLGAGASGAVPTGAGPANGVQGVALRRVSDGNRVLTAAANFANSTATITWTAAQLAPYVGQEFTIDVIDTRNGGWGWMIADDFSVPGARTGEPRTVIDDFEDGSIADWYVSGGMNATRPRTASNPEILYGLRTSGSTGSPTETLNVYATQNDRNTSVAYGQFFTVDDDTASVSFRLYGGSHASSTDMRSGATGIALWDAGTGDFVPGSFVTRTASGDNYEEIKSISLAGLAGRTVCLVALDRNTGSWGHTGLDTITAPDGAVTFSDNRHHIVRFDYGFDNAGDLMGWTGDTASFQIGRVGSSSSLIAGHINQKATFTLGEGYLSSTDPSGSETPTGILRSPDFTVTGDIIEFYLSGGSTNDMGLELVRSVDDVVLLSARNSINSNDFAYDFWNVHDLFGTEAYLRLRDERSSGGWGHIEVDAIRMVDFNTPEPTSLVLLGAGIAALVERRRRRRYAASGDSASYASRTSP